LSAASGPMSRTLVTHSIRVARFVPTAKSCRPRSEVPAAAQRLLCILSCEEHATLKRAACETASASVSCGVPTCVNRMTR
jgi:hypothetical protein